MADELPTTGGSSTTNTDTELHRLLEALRLADERDRAAIHEKIDALCADALVKAASELIGLAIDPKADPDA